MARSSVVVATDAGGVGKTLVSLLLTAGRPGCQPYGFDRRAKGAPSKFARLLAADGRGGIADLVSDRAVGDVRHKSQFLESYAQIGDAVLAGGAVVDTGAKAASGFAEWCRGAEVGRLLREDGAPVWIVVPVTASTAALRAGRETIERLSARGVLDAYPPVIVFNGVHGEFDEILGNADLAWLQGRVVAKRAKCVVMPRCRGGVLPFIEAERLGFSEALSIAPADFAARFDVSEDRALWWLRCFADFVADVLGGFAGAGLGREPVEERRRFTELDNAWGRAADRIKAGIVGRVQSVAVPVGVGVGETGVLRAMDRDDAALSSEAFPDMLQLIGQELAAAAARDVKPDYETTRRAVEASFRAMEARIGRAGLHPRLGKYRRDVVLEAKARGLDPASHRVAAVSYVYDLQDLGWRGAFRAVRFLSRYHGETIFLHYNIIKERSWPPAIY